MEGVAGFGEELKWEVFPFAGSKNKKGGDFFSRGWETGKAYEGS